MPTAVTDRAGNYTLELGPGMARLCAVSDGIAVDCDCPFTVMLMGAPLRRDYRVHGGIRLWEYSDTEFDCAADAIPVPQHGAWGWVARRLPETTPAGSPATAPIENVNVCVSPLIGTAPEGCASTDHHGRYSIEVTGGEYRVCSGPQGTTSNCVYCTAGPTGAIYAEQLDATWSACQP
jgi:hypothetical protein